MVDYVFQVVKKKWRKKIRKTKDVPISDTLPETAKLPENKWLEDEMSFWGPAYFQMIQFD